MPGEDRGAGTAGDASIDLAALQQWLARAHPELLPAGATLSATRYPGGFSNHTYRLDGAAGDGPMAYVLRRPPPGIPTGIAHDMVREYGILAALHPLGLPVPRPLACCADAAVLGAPFYLMEVVEGEIVRHRIPETATAGHDRAPVVRALSRTVVDALARLHAVDVTAGPLAALGKPDGYAARQVQGWTRRWEASRTSALPAMDAVAHWLAHHVPSTSRVALLHNDFKLDNLVLSPDLTDVRAILDWEMATIGDPLMDLGTTLAYWVEAGDDPLFRSLGLGVTALPGAYTRAEVIAAYAEATGHPVPHAVFYETFGIFKVAVIAQQIYARYVAGKTTDARFAGLGAVVEALANRALGNCEGTTGPR
jgi:aminoglycoside phosphotransferase (APT) family kinase protein